MVKKYQAEKPAPQPAPQEDDERLAREAHLATLRAGSRWLDAEEAAAYIKRSTKTVANMTNLNRLHPRYPDRRPLYDRRELDDVIATSPQAPPGSTTRGTKKGKATA